MRDGAVHSNFAEPKHVLEIFRALCQGTVAAIVAQFTRKKSANLFTGRGGKLMGASKAVKSNTDFELVTWLMIK